MLILESNVKIDKLFSDTKKNVMNFLEKSANKSIKLFSMASKYDDYDIYDAFELYDMIKSDEDIKNLLEELGICAKMKFATNRYAQTMPILTLYKFERKTKTGWT